MFPALCQACWPYAISVTSLALPQPCVAEEKMGLAWLRAVESGFGARPGPLAAVPVGAGAAGDSRPVPAVAGVSDTHLG